MANRWFIVPLEESDVGERPKYSDSAQVESWAGNVIVIDATDPWTVFATVGTGEQYYLARFFGDSQTLDSIASNSDATDLSQVSNSKYWVRVILNDLLDKDLTADEWVERFTVGGSNT